MTGINRSNTFSFNKELVLGESGALISAPLVSDLVAHFTSHARLISLSAVIGGVLGAAVFWLAARAYDKEKAKSLSLKGLASDVLYFTPVAFLLAVLVYYPTLYLLSDELLGDRYHVLPAVIAAQLTAFSLFLICINIYRYLLAKVRGKVL